ncbi:hypothetical protein D9M68_706600 [compost metagenome]
MIRYLLCFIFFCSPVIDTKAQDTTSAYTLQRNRINILLNERSAKFSRYDQSLAERSGIFGFQTKKDLRNSNEILRQIVLNDNAIFQELKVLLDYKDLQMQEVKSQSVTSDDRIQGYRKTIKGQEEEIQRLTALVKKNETGKDIYMASLIIAGVCLIFSTYRLFWSK